MEFSKLHVCKTRIFRDVDGMYKTMPKLYSIFVLINGNPSINFQMQRGLCQGTLLHLCFSQSPWRD